jgi:hypothetical protein
LVLRRPRGPSKAVGPSSGCALTRVDSTSPSSASGKVLAVIIRGEARAAWGSGGAEGARRCPGRPPGAAAAGAAVAACRPCCCPCCCSSATRKITLFSSENSDRWVMSVLRAMPLSRRLRLVGPVGAGSTVMTGASGSCPRATSTWPASLAGENTGE